MPSGILSLPTTNKYNIFNRRFAILVTLGIGSAAAFLMYRRKSNISSKHKELNRRKGSHCQSESGNPVVVSKAKEEPNSENSNQTEELFESCAVQEGNTKTDSPSSSSVLPKATIQTEMEEANEVQNPDIEKAGGCSSLENGSGQEEGEAPSTWPAQLGEQQPQNAAGEGQKKTAIQDILDQQSSLDWIEAIETGEEAREEAEQQQSALHLPPSQQKQQQQQQKEEEQEANGMQNSPKPLYSGRSSTDSVRQHPVNSICTCHRCLETLNDLQSSRGYKNAESPHSTHSEGSADSGRATGPLTSCSPFAVDELGQSEILPIYEFEVPNTLVGLIIGVKGKTIRELCFRANVRMLIRPHHTPSKYESHQICSVEGRREDINKCLHMIRLRFPPCRFADLNLKPVLPPPPSTSSTTARGAPTALTLPVGVPCEIYISAHVDAGHFFLQLPTHASFSSLAVLDQYMLSVYTQPGGAPEIPKPCNVGVLCAAPAYNGWFRAITLAYESEQDESLVRFVDYGGFARLPRTDLRQIRTDFMTLPMQAIECYLANVQPIDGSTHWSEKANELFQKLCVSKIIQAALMGYCKQDGIPCVELYVLDENKKTVRVDQMLLERGLAKPADPTMMVKNSLIGSPSG